MFFVSAGVPNGEFPEILIAKCRSRFYCTWFFWRAEDFESWRKGPSKSGEKCSRRKVHMYVYIMSHDFNIMSHVCILDSWLLYNVTWLQYNYSTAARRGRGVYCFTSVLPSVQDIFRRIFLSNCWWQKSDIWSQASYRYTILWVAFLDPSDSYFLFVDLVDFYTHWRYMHIFRHIFLSK